MLPGGSRIICMIYDTFPGMGLYGIYKQDMLPGLEDPHHLITTEGSDLDDKYI